MNAPKTATSTTVPEPVDPSLVFLARAAARHALVEAGEQDLEEAIIGLIEPFEQLVGRLSRHPDRLGAPLPADQAQVEEGRPMRSVSVRMTNYELDAIAASLDVNGACRTSDADLHEMNAQYAVVKIGGKTRVVSLEESPAYPGSKVPVFSTINDFCAFHANRKKEVAAPDGTIKRVGIGRWWIDH